LLVTERLLRILLLEQQVFSVARNADETTLGYNKYAPMKYLEPTGLRLGREVMPKAVSRAICTICVSESDDLGKLERARSRVVRLKGIVKSEADHVFQILTVEYDPEIVTLEEIRNLIRRA